MPLEVKSFKSMETIEYFSDSNEPLTFEQVTKSKSYVELHKVDGYRRRELFFKNGELQHVEYYASDDESDGGVLSLYANVIVCIYRLISEVNGYRRYDGIVYSPEGVILQKEIMIYNSFDQFVYSANVNTLDGSLSNITKWAYGQDGELEYEFDYNNAGDFIKCHIHIIHDENPNGYFKPEDIGVRADVSFTWDGYEYYLHSEPKIPGEIIV